MSENAKLRNPDAEWYEGRIRELSAQLAEAWAEVERLRAHLIIVDKERAALRDDVARRCDHLAEIEQTREDAQERAEQAEARLKAVMEAAIQKLPTGEVYCRLCRALDKHELGCPLATAEEGP